MARKQTLKVFRTPIGFHDAYVAAPSQKAALVAWGSDADLFARGIAERVEDPALIAEPLANPGTVIRRSRGTTAEQIAALPADAPRPEQKAAAPSGSPGKVQPRRPRPSRAPVDAAERALEDAEAANRTALDEFAQRERDFARERAHIERKAERERDRLRQAIDDARDAYEAAMRDWRG